MKSGAWPVICAAKPRASSRAPISSLTAAGPQNRVMRAFVVAIALACVPTVLQAQAPAPMSSPVPARAAGAEPAPSPNTPAGPPRGAQAVREFLGLGPPPDPAAAKRG